jgi:hypothetical protein
MVGQATQGMSQARIFVDLPILMQAPQNCTLIAPVNTLRIGEPETIRKFTAAIWSTCLANIAGKHFCCRLCPASFDATTFILKRNRLGPTAMGQMDSITTPAPVPE